MPAPWRNRVRAVRGTEEHIDRPFQDVELSYRPVELRSHIDRAFETDEIVVLDAESRVEFWNHTTEDLWGLRRDEVVGRPFFELDIGLPVQELSDEIEGALESDRGGTRVLQAHDRRGRPVECRVTTSALVDPDEAISGAILLTEATLREQD